METKMKTKIETQNRYTDSGNVYKLKYWIQDFNIEPNGLYRNSSEGAGKIFEKIYKKICIHNPKSTEHPLKILSLNPSEWAREYLKKHPEHIDYYWLSQNPSHWAYDILRKNPSKIDWFVFVKNPAVWAEKLVRWKIGYSRNCTTLDLPQLFTNPAEWAGRIVQIFSMKPVWYLLCENPGEWAGVLMNENLDKINWFHLCKNPGEWARELLEKNVDKIDYPQLIYNPAKWAWNLFIKQNNILGQDWHMISHHSCAWVVEELKNNPRKINWHPLSKNPHIFEYDYVFLRERCWKTFGEELMQVCFHPRNLSKFSDWGYDSGLEEDLDEE